MKKTALFLVLLLIFSFTGCSDDYVASVNGEKISIGEFNCYMFFVKNTIISSGGEDTDEYWNTFEIEGKKAGDVVKETALKNAIEYTLKAQYAKKIGADRSEKAIKNQRAIYIQDAFGGSEEDYLTRLSELGLTDKDFSIVIMKDYLANEYFNNADVDLPTDAEIRQYYNENYYRTKHIVIDFERFASDSSDGRVEAIKEVDEILTKIENGTQFEELLNISGEDINSDSSAGYIYTSGGINQSIENVVKELQIGEVSSVVETDFSYHIIKRYEIDSYYDYFLSSPSTLYSDMTGKDEIIKLVQNAKRINMVDDLKEKSKIKTNNKIIEELTIVVQNEE